MHILLNTMQASFEGTIIFCVVIKKRMELFVTLLYYATSVEYFSVDISDYI